jgi:peptide deformylase
LATREVRREGDEILRKRSKPVAGITEKIKTLLDDMAETMRASEGVGLAAPQVGVLRRICVVEHGDKFYELINPEIVETSGAQRKAEACLSVPNKRGYVTRPASVKVRATNRDGEEFEFSADDVLAVAVCHEIDHLDGVLYIDRAERFLEEDEDEDE